MCGRSLRRKAHKCSVSVGLALALSACKGGAIQRPAAPAPGTPDASLALASDICSVDSAALKTEARLVNTVLQSGAPDNALTYELALIGCDGHHHEISDQPIFFAIDAEVGAEIKSDFVAAIGSEEVRGLMQLVDGEDLFGARGPEFFHHRTDKALSMADTSADTALQFTVHLGGQRFYPVGGGAGRGFTANTFVRIGDSAPAVQPVPIVNWTP